MIANFHINYKTKWGEQVAIQLRRKGKEENLLLHSFDGENWQSAIEVAVKEQIEYKYFIQNDETSSLEFGDYRTLQTPANADQLFIQDHWRPTNVTEQAFFSAAFKDVIFKRKKARA